MRAKAVLALLLSFQFLVPVTQAIAVERPTVLVGIHAELTNVADRSQRALLQVFAVVSPDGIQGGTTLSDHSAQGDGEVSRPAAEHHIDVSNVSVTGRDDIVGLSGTVERSTDANLVGASVSIMANRSSGEISLTIIHAGLVSTYQGIGHVFIRCLVC